MGKRVTIKDIAELAGVSLGAAHYALSGKPGVSEETRQRVMEVAKRYNYHSNRAAAALKRKTIRIAVILPEQTGDNRFYISYFWRGLHRYLESMRDFNLEIMENPFKLKDGALEGELEALHDSGDIQGIICAPGYMTEEEKKMICRFGDSGAAVAYVGEDIEGSERLCCVQPDYNVIGKMVTEMLVREIAPGASILLCAGDERVPSHYHVVEGVERYLKAKGLSNPVSRHYSLKNKEDFCREVTRELKENGAVGACFAVTARESILLGKALGESGRAGRISAVGSDMFTENVQLLKDGVFTNLLNKNPYSQSQIAARYLVEYLVQGTKPPHSRMYVGSEVVFQSSLPMYEEDGSSRLFL